MPGRDTLKQQQRDSVEVVKRQAELLGATASPKIARDAFDTIIENAQRAVRSVEIIAREEGDPCS